ncbi:unnamed protein product [Albugo candida]|uniref:Uncharacterized protein n=1 Tax=Albugo candida TaxID=65357 RepID=A0A024GC13_9STRA|nr:unnamed protein product [Albugo candida]|eukprot:CCI43862.1 unnamed protein product [Albugo candida]
MRLIGSFPSPGFQAFSHSKLLAGAKCEFCISQINRAPVLESRYVYANTCIRSIHCFIQLLQTFPPQKRIRCRTLLLQTSNTSLSSRRYRTTMRVRVYANNRWRKIPVPAIFRFHVASQDIVSALYIPRDVLFQARRLCSAPRRLL